MFDKVNHRYENLDLDDEAKLALEAKKWMVLYFETGVDLIIC